MDPALQTFTVNGQINPVLTMRPNEYQVINMVDNAAAAFYVPETIEIDPTTASRSLAKPLLLTRAAMA